MVPSAESLPGGCICDLTRVPQALHLIKQPMVSPSLIPNQNSYDRLAAQAVLQLMDGWMDGWMDGYLQLKQGSYNVLLRASLSRNQEKKPILMFCYGQHLRSGAGDGGKGRGGC